MDINRTYFKFLAFSILLLFQALHAYDDQPVCYRDLQLYFFKPELVGQALSAHNVYQSQWFLVNQQLEERSKDVPRRVKERAERYGIHNPLQNPFNAPVAAKILWEVLYEIFREVMNLHNITNASDTREMFEYIQLGQKDYIESCLGIEIRPTKRQEDS